jgi:hypothetical protein
MDGDNALECHDTNSQTEREEIENKLLKNNNLTQDDLKYMTLEEYYRQEIKKDEPLILVFYLDRQLFTNKEMLELYSKQVKSYFDETGTDVRLFFMPTENNERIECINPVYIDNQNDHDKLLNLVDQLSLLFQVGVDNEALKDEEE